VATPISVVQLGRTSYAEGLRLQQRLVERRKCGELADVLLLLEHTPVITLGRNAKAANVLVPAEQLAARGVEVFDCDRGGDVTFHGPGQIVGYPIFDLRGFERSQVSDLRSQENSSQFPVLSSQKTGSKLHAPSVQEEQNGPTPSSTRKTLGVVDYVRCLEEVLIRTCAEFGIPTKRVAGLTGVWTDPSQDEHSREGHDFSRADAGPGENAALAAEGGIEAKIAAIGVHISRSVTSHGFALNVNTDLSYFSLIVPCGISARPVTSMRKELGRDVGLDGVAQSLVRNCGAVFGRQILWLESVEALLGPVVGVPVKAPEALRRLRGEEDLFNV